VAIETNRYTGYWQQNLPARWTRRLEVEIDAVPGARDGCLRVRRSIKLHRATERYNAQRTSAGDFEAKRNRFEECRLLFEIQPG
jgi:hypothetical protein